MFIRRNIMICCILCLALFMGLIGTTRDAFARPVYLKYQSQFDANEIWLVHYEPDGTKVRELMTANLTEVVPCPLTGYHYDVTRVLDIEPRHDPCENTKPTPYYYFEWKEERIQTNCIPLYWDYFPSSVAFYVGVNRLGEGWELLRETMFIFGAMSLPKTRFVQYYRGPDSQIYGLTPGQPYAIDPILLEDHTWWGATTEFDDATPIDYICSDTPSGTLIEAVLGIKAIVTFGSVWQEGYTWLAESSDVIDQQQPQIDTTVGGLAIGDGSDQKLAQVVTAGTSGVLSEVRFPVACSSGDLIVEIQEVTEGIPNGVVLTSQTIPGSSLPTFYPSPPEFRSFVFSTPVSFSAGRSFAIVLQSAGECGVFQGPIGNPYPGGDAYFDALPNLPGWVLLGDRSDLPFQTIVGPGNPGSYLEDFNFLHTFYEIATSAKYFGGVKVSLKYDEFDIPANRDESNLKMFHLEGTSWMDVTSSLDTEQNIIHGHVSSLSWFAIGVTINQSPIAKAGDDQTDVPAGPDCMASVTLDGSQSDDLDDDPLTYSWTWDDSSATGVNPIIQLSPGTHTIILVVNDGAVDSDPDIVDVTVIDNTLPIIHLSDPKCVNVGRGKGKMANKLTLSASDNCSGEVNPIIDKVEIFNKGGNLVKGEGVYDIIENDIYIYPHGKGRSICVTATATDKDGNSNSERICKPLLKCKK